MLQQMFQVTSTHFHAATQTFAPLTDSVVDHCRWTRESVVGYQATRVLCPSTWM